MATRVAIVGGGLMGLSAAFHLGRADPRARVAVLERARVGDAASGA
ncbi:MAG TPA: FAD-dependent oxidoreductase, partial [Methylomirabilota bacterium]|nr:FAD-dependent oxidoreductase [Methylomirabilota bacterium]